MTRPTGPMGPLLLVLTVGGTSVLLGLGAVTVTSALGAPADRELGNAVVFDPAMVTASTPTTPGKPGAPVDQPVAGDHGTATAPGPAPNVAPAPAPAPNHAPAPVVTHAPDHHPQQVMPVPPSSADGEHRVHG